MFTHTQWRDYLEGCFPEWVAGFALPTAWRIKLLEIPTAIETWANPRGLHLHLSPAADRTLLT